MGSGCLAYGIFNSNSSSFRAINLSCSWANILLACPTVFGNVALIAALATSRDKNKPYILLLVNLAVTDILTGLVSMPSFSYVFHMIASGHYPCSVVSFNSPFTFTICSTSGMTVAMISMERYVSVFHPYHHTSRITFKMTLLFVAIAWVLSVLVIVPSIAGSNGFFLNVCIATFAITCTTLSIYCYLRILLRARKVRKQVHSQAARLGQTNSSITDKRYVSVGGFIIFSMIVCFSPIAASNSLWLVGFRNENMNEIRCWEWTLVMANSIINPVITCIFCPPMRWKVFKVLTCRSNCKN